MVLWPRRSAGARLLPPAGFGENRQLSRRAGQASHRTGLGRLPIVPSPHVRSTSCMPLKAGTSTAHACSDVNPGLSRLITP
jgi:hypothetical protein